MDAELIIFIHDFLTEFFENHEDPISPPGVKNRDTIESAVARPFATAGGREAYPTKFLKAASLFHSIVGNHSFHNGNKRTALLSTLYLLSEFGYIVKCDDDEMFEFTRQVAAHEITDSRSDEVEVIADWLERNSRKEMKQENPMKLPALREALSRFGYDIVPHDDKLAVQKDGETREYILKKGTHGVEDYDPIYISGLRGRLELTVNDGIDSACFYGLKGISSELSDFTRIRIEVMKKLAKI